MLPKLPSSAFALSPGQTNQLLLEKAGLEEELKLYTRWLKENGACQICNSNNTLMIARITIEEKGKYSKPTMILCNTCYKNAIPFDFEPPMPANETGTCYHPCKECKLATNYNQICARCLNCLDCCECIDLKACISCNEAICDCNRKLQETIFDRCPWCNRLMR